MGTFFKLEFECCPSILLLKIKLKIHSVLKERFYETLSRKGFYSHIFLIFRI